MKALTNEEIATCSINYISDPQGDDEHGVENQHLHVLLRAREELDGRTRLLTERWYLYSSPNIS